MPPSTPGAHLHEQSPDDVNPGWILGISAYYHDSAAALVDRHGCIVAAAQQERFSRRKHDACFPAEAINYCLAEANIGLSAVSQIIFYDKPLLKFERLLETYLAFSPRGLRSFLQAMPVWIKEKLYLKACLRKELGCLSGIPVSRLPPLRFTEHHQSHAAAAFYPSPFQRAVVLCVDGVGEWATLSAWLGNGKELLPLWEQRFPHSLGLLYSAFTQYLGFRVNSGEYKMMGLAPYGKPSYADRILETLVQLDEDGSFRLNMRYFDFATGLSMTNARFHSFFGRSPRAPENAIEAFHQDIACSIQTVTEEIMFRLARTVSRETGENQLCLGGGVALNSVANGQLLRSGLFEHIWIQPAAGDAGSALGAALCGHYQLLGQPRTVMKNTMHNTYLGPACNASQTETQFLAQNARFQVMEEQELIARVAHFIAEGAVVGWIQGRAEFGPRALGNRSILADPRRADMQQTLNSKIKHRESFRPFAPVVVEERAAEIFDIDHPSPYMQFVVPIKKKYIDRLPAISHVDGSARLQTVNPSQNPRLHALLLAYGQRTGLPVLINTSFNRRGEPMVATAVQAYECFMATEMDYLVIDNLLLSKSDQPEPAKGREWEQTFEPD